MVLGKPPAWVLGALGHLAAAIVLLLAAYILEKNPAFWTTKSPLDVVSALGAGYAAIWTVWLLNKRTINSERNLQHARLAEQAGRFQKGAELLTSDKIAARVGGVVLLREVALLNPAQYYNAVLNLLIVFAEEQTKQAWTSYQAISEFKDQRDRPEWVAATKPTPDDVVAAVDSIGRIRSLQGRDVFESLWIGDGAKLRIHRVIFADCTIRGGCFDMMEIEEAFFSNVLFADCRFTHTEVSKLDVISASFHRCQLNHASIATHALVDDANFDRILRFDGACDLEHVTIEAPTERVSAPARPQTASIHDIRTAGDQANGEMQPGATLAPVS